MVKPYVLLDSARMLDKINAAKEINTQFCSLYNGESEKSLETVAPYLFVLDEELKFIKWLRKKGWGNSWGIYLYSEQPMSEIRHHFRKFILVQSEEGEEMYFRFYDPRVLRLFLPTCERNQLGDFFGPVSHFVLEAEDPAQAIVYSISKGLLHVETKPVEDLRLMSQAIK